MIAYVVVVENIRTGHRRVSSSAYRSILQAHEFCLGRSGNVKKHNNFLFYDGIYRYEIAEIKII